MKSDVKVQFQGGQFFSAICNAMMMRQVAGCWLHAAINWQVAKRGYCKRNFARTRQRNRM